MAAAAIHAASPRAITAPHISWILLTIYWCRSQVSNEILGSAVSPLADEKVSIRLLVYLSRCWNAAKPPPQSLQQLCEDVVKALLPHQPSVLAGQAPAAWTQTSGKSSMRRFQVEAMIHWLEQEWTALHDLAQLSPGALAVQIVRIMEVAALCLEDERANEEEHRQDSALERTVDRRSPLGVPIRRMRLALEAMDEMQCMPAIAQDFSRWKSGASDAAPSTRPERGTTSSLFDELPDRLDVFHKMQDARRRGDYSATKELIHQFFSYAPPVPQSHSGPRSGHGAAAAAHGANTQRTKLHHQALLSLAAFQVEWREWYAAEETLREAIHLSRAERDNAALDNCQRLTVRIEAAKERQRVALSGKAAMTEHLLDGIVSDWRISSSSQSRNTPTTISAPTSHSGVSTNARGQPSGQASAEEAYNLTYDSLLDAVVCSREGNHNLEQILAELDKAANLLPLPANLSTDNHAGLKQPAAAPTGEPPRTMISQSSARPWPTLSYLHSRAGDVANARAYRSLADAEPYAKGLTPAGNEDRLSLQLQEAWELAEAGQYDNALQGLTQVRIIESLSLKEYRRWAWGIWRILHLAMRRAGDKVVTAKISRIATGRDEMDDQIEEHEDVDEMGLASPGSDHSPSSPLHLADVQLNQLLQEAESLVEAGQGERAVVSTTQLLDATQRLGRSVLNGRARLLLARIQGFVFTDHHRQALQTVEDMMPAYLADHNVERKGDVCWTYARLILAAAKASARAGSSLLSTSGGYALEEVRACVRWLERAREFYIRASPPLRMEESEDHGMLTTETRRCTPKLVPVLHFLARLHSYVGENDRGEEYSRQAIQLQQRQHEAAPPAPDQAWPDLDRWRELIARVGARISRPAVMT
ncbi:unnamed protein product [Parajaminaea phylloscopi]